MEKNISLYLNYPLYIVKYFLVKYKLVLEKPYGYNLWIYQGEPFSERLPVFQLGSFESYDGVISGLNILDYFLYLGKQNGTQDKFFKEIQYIEILKTP